MVTNVTTCVSSPMPGKNVAAVGLQVLEDSILVAGVADSSMPRADSTGFIDLGEEYSNIQNTTLEGISLMMGCPAVDALLQFDHVVCIGSAPLTGFRPAGPRVQYRSNMALVSQSSQSASVLQVPIATYHLSKFSPSAAPGRPMVQLVSVRSIPIDSEGSAPVGEAIPGCQLWANFGFDRITPGDHTALVLANTMPEYYTLRTIFLTIPDRGSCAIPVAQCTSGDVTFVSDVFTTGSKVGEVEVSLKCGIIPFNTLKPSRSMEEDD